MGLRMSNIVNWSFNSFFWNVSFQNLYSFLLILIYCALLSVLLVHHVVLLFVSAQHVNVSQSLSLNQICLKQMLSNLFFLVFLFSHFSFQCTSFSEILTTLVWFFTSVNHIFKTTSVRESLSTLATLMCLFTNVSHYMHSKMINSRKLLSHTHNTGMVFNLCE